MIALFPLSAQTTHIETSQHNFKHGKNNWLKRQKKVKKRTTMTDEEKKDFKRKFASAKKLKQDAARKKNLAAQNDKKHMFVANFNAKKSSDAAVVNVNGSDNDDGSDIDDGNNGNDGDDDDKADDDGEHGELLDMPTACEVTNFPPIVADLDKEEKFDIGKEENIEGGGTELQN